MTALAAPIRTRGIWRSPAVGSAGLLVAAVLLWWVASTVTFVLPDPVKTVSVLLSNLADPAYAAHVRATATLVALAFLIGTAIGGLAGLGLGISRWARVIFEPLVIGLNGVPKIVLYPVMLPILQLTGSKVAMGALFALFPVLINVEAGVREIPVIFRKLTRSLDSSWRQFFIYIVLPAIRAPLLTGVRLAVSLATVGVVLSEFFATERGLGRVVLHAYGQGHYADMVATILLLISVSFVLSLALWRLERRVR